MRIGKAMLFVIIAFVSACSSTTPSQPLGRFVLASIDGVALPAPTSMKIIGTDTFASRTLADTLQLSPDGTYRRACTSLNVTILPVPGDTTLGVWALQGTVSLTPDSLFLSPSTLGYFTCSDLLGVRRAGSRLISRIERNVFETPIGSNVEEFRTDTVEVVFRRRP